MFTPSIMECKGWVPFMKMIGSYMGLYDLRPRSDVLQESPENCVAWRQTRRRRKGIELSEGPQHSRIPNQRKTVAGSQSLNTIGHIVHFVVCAPHLRALCTSGRCILLLPPSIKRCPRCPRGAARSDRRSSVVVMRCFQIGSIVHKRHNPLPYALPSLNSSTTQQDLTNP